MSKRQAILFLLFFLIVAFDLFTYFSSYLPCKRFIIERQPNMTLCWVESLGAFLINLFIILPTASFFISQYFFNKYKANDPKKKYYPYLVTSIVFIGILLWYYLYLN